MHYGVMFQGLVSPEDIRQSARIGMDGGVDRFWLSDHIVHAGPRYELDWVDPFVTLAAVAEAGGPEAWLGTAVLVGPLYDPVLTSRAVATLSLRSRHPFRLGLGLGWSEEDYRCVGREFRARGRLLDEFIEDIRHLWGTAESPRDTVRTAKAERLLEPAVPAQVWVGGGASDGAPLPPRVAARIAAADGWILNANNTPEESARDVAHVATLGGRVRSMADCAQLVYCHVPEPGQSREAAQAEQLEAFGRYFGPARGPDHVRRVCWIGSWEDIAARALDARDAGLPELIVALPDYGPEQMRRLVALRADLEARG